MQREISHYSHITKIAFNGSNDIMTRAAAHLVAGLLLDRMASGLLPKNWAVSVEGNARVSIESCNDGEGPARSAAAHEACSRMGELLGGGR